MSLPRRAWRVLADPPTSDTSSILRIAVPLWGLMSLLAVIPNWPVPLHRLIDVAWLYVVLWVIRQRDQARAETAALRKDRDCSCSTADGQKILAWPNTPGDEFVRCGVCDGRVASTRKAGRNMR